MSPNLTLPAQSELEASKMSVVQLEQFVSFIVKRSCRNGSDPDHVAARPKWWPSDVAFSYPISRARTMDIAKWRETLLDVIARCYTYRGRDDTFRRADKSVRSAANLTRRREAQIQRRGSDESVAVLATATASATATDRTLSEEPLNATPGLSPVISLCDVLKLQPKENVEVKPVSKNDFLTYFKLSDTQHCSVILNNNLYKPSHPLHLLNTHQIPFSSDLGKRMTKECHIVPHDIHLRKIERVERYLTTVISTDTAKPVEYEVSFNRNPRYSHTYVFPTKVYRRKERISSKATFLLMHHCRPCTVELEKYKIPPKETVQSNQIVPNVNQQTIFLPEREELIETLATSKENTPSNLAPPNAFGAKHKTSNQRIVKEASILKTLTPKNENSVPVENNNVLDQKIGRDDDLLDGSVLLTPMDDFFGLQSAKSVNSNSEIKEIKSKNRKVEINRVQKRRVIIYHPRRFSLRVLRLKYDTNNK